MSIFMSDGSFRQRAKYSEEATEASRESRRWKVALQTYDTLRNFEDTLQAQAARAYDDIPSEALPMRWTHGPASTLSRPASEPLLATVTHENGSERDPRRLRPPSPLHFYDYGCITLTSRSKLMQHRSKLGKLGRRAGGRGFFVPGPHFKQGTYGDKLLDPCLMPQMCWAPPVVGCPTRRGPDLSDLRPLTTQELQVGRRKPRTGEPMPELVRGNVAYSQRAKLNNEAIHKRRREAVIEHKRFENGIFVGSWRDPCLDPEGLQEFLAPEDFAWISGSLEALLAGKSEEELGLSPARLNAFLLLVHLEHALREAKTTVSKIFMAENKGPKCQLEVAQFSEGLRRLGLLAELDLTEEGICEAMHEIDPGFDGRVYLPVVDRALKSLGHAASPHRRCVQRVEDQGVLAYGETAPVRQVAIPMEADSINNFRKAFKGFRDQQHDLLAFHSNMKTGEEKQDSE